MKPGITQLCLARQDLEADLSKARNLGYEAIELVFSDNGSRTSTPLHLKSPPWGRPAETTDSNCVP